MTKLSINVNKFATIRNARGGNNPDLVQIVKDCERFGAEGITVHPRPDQRHITHQDVYDIKNVVSSEYNIEGYPNERLLKLISDVKPTQATLVPDPPDVLTSNAGWDAIKNKDFLKDVVKQIQSMGVRVSLFIDPVEKQIETAALTGTDRIELYTEAYASQFLTDKKQGIDAYIKSANLARNLGLGVNAGHDLDLDNLNYLKAQIPFIDEVSIGHALVCDALYLGLENTIQMYKRALQNA